MTADVTVIIPTFNRQEFIGTALQSIRSQTFVPSQIIVVDDGSTDGTADVVRQFGPDIELISKPNGGKSTALNLGLAHATGDQIWIFDDDDIAAPNGLQLMHDALDGNPEAAFAYGAYSTFRTEDEARLYLHPPQWENVTRGGAYIQTLGLYPGLMVRNFIMQPGMLVRKKHYDEIGPFDEQLIRSQDYEMLLRLARHYPAQQVGDVVFHQRQHRGRRGSLAKPVEAGQIFHTWGSYDQPIFRAIYANHHLAEFLPERPATEFSDDDKVTALFIRGCIMGRRQLWDLAADDFGVATTLCAAIGRISLNPVERFAMRHLLDGSHYAPESILGSPAFCTVLRQIPGWRLRENICSALLFPLPYVVRTYVKNKRWAEALAIARTYLALATPNSAISSIIAKVYSKVYH